MTTHYAVYILASRRNGTLYTGVTNNLPRRVWEHKNDVTDGFTKKYKIHMLVYYEMYQNVIAAITREKEIKNYKRSWKIQLIEQGNPIWEDLYFSL